jgi:hypothetical protein
VQHRRAELAGQLPRDGHRAAKGIPSHRCRLGRDAGRKAVGQLAPVDRDADAAQDRDAERAAQLDAGLVDPRGRSGPLRWRRPDDQLGGQAEDRGQAQGDDHRPGHQRRQAVGGADLGEHPKANRPHRQAASDQLRRVDPPHHPRAELGPDDEPQRRRQRPQPRLQRRQPQHQLQVLRNERRRADGNEDGQEVGGQRRVEGGDAEQRQVDHRIGQPALTAHEPHPDRQPGQDAQGRHDDEAVLDKLLQPVDHRQDRDHRQGRGGKVQPSGTRVAVLGQHPRAQHQQDGHHRQRQQEDRAPPEPLQQRPTQHRADRAADREGADPHGDGQRPLPGVLEHVKQQRQRRWRQGRPGDPQQRPGHDQHLGAGGERRQQRDDPEGRGADHQQPAAADAVAEGAHGEQRPGDHEPVDVDDPQQLGAAGLQVGADGRDGQLQHRQVHHVQHVGNREHRQPDPRTPPGAGCVCSGHQLHLVVSDLHERASISTMSRREVPQPVAPS